MNAMTPKERVAAVFDSLHSIQICELGAFDEPMELLEKEFEVAIAAERERCASIIDQFAAELHEPDGENIGRNILLMAAKKIRDSQA